MKRYVRLAAVAILVTAVLGTLQFAWPGGAAVADTIDLSFDSLTPAPFTTVAPGPVLIGAHANSDAALTTVKLSLGGQQIQQIGSQTETFLAISQQQVLSAGVYTATVQATDADGQTFQAQWDFIVSSNLGDGEWFTAAGTPKADQINATIKSLVQAFRWHLFGLSWDGANHPDLPSHVGLTGTGDPVGPWVTGTTFDQSQTDATLRSLVEAFRWHFWGISWDGNNHPDIPTHASTIQPPQSIDPWFTASGDPIPANITATLRSLVEAFRWHFWGYSWDGSNHPDMPTHASFGSNGSSTPTPTPTNTPTSTAPSEGHAIFQTSLKDLFGFTEFGTGSNTPTNFGDELKLPPDAYGGATKDGLVVDDASYSVTVRNLTQAGDAMGCVIFRSPGGNASGNYYEYCLLYSSNSVVGADFLLATTSGGSSVTIVEDIADFTVASNMNASDLHTLKAIAQGDQFWFYVDGKYLGTASYDGPSSGTAGFAGHNLNDSTQQRLEFINLSVETLAP